MSELVANPVFIVPKYMGFDTGGQDCSRFVTWCVGKIQEEIENPTFDHYETRNFHCWGWEDYRKNTLSQYEFDGDVEHFKSWMTLAGMIINKTHGYDYIKKRIPTLYWLCKHTKPKQEWYSGLESDGFVTPYVLDISTGKVSYNPL